MSIPVTGPVVDDPGVDRNGHELVTRRFHIGLHGVVGELPDEVLHGYAAAAVREALGQRGKVAVGPVTVRVTQPAAGGQPARGGVAVVEVVFRAGGVGDDPPAEVVVAREGALQQPVTIERVSA